MYVDSHRNLLVNLGLVQNVNLNRNYITRALLLTCNLLKMSAIFRSFGLFFHEWYDWMGNCMNALKVYCICALIKVQRHAGIDCIEDMQPIELLIIKLLFKV